MREVHLSGLDLNLLPALEALLKRRNVSHAAEDVGLSQPAMSRALARLRAATGDPLLVRAGRGLVPSPRALELREVVSRLVQDSEAVLRPAAGLDPAKITRSFTLRARDGFIENFGAALVARVAVEAPGVRLRFVQKTNRESTPLRDGSVDLETGVVGPMTGPEIRTQALFRDRFIGVVRRGHPLCRGRVTPARFAAGRHVGIARQGDDKGPIDAALAALGLARDISVVVEGFAAAIALARGSDLVATVPERHTGNLRADMHSFALPVAAPEITVSMLWHPRTDADPAHRWLRKCLREVCAI